MKITGYEDFQIQRTVNSLDTSYFSGLSTPSTVKTFGVFNFNE